MRTLPLLLVLIAAPSAGAAAAQDALEEAKAHYAAASYEEALSTLTRVDAAPAPCKSHASCPMGKPVTFCLVPGGHGIWSQSVPVEWAFLKAL